MGQQTHALVIGDLGAVIVGQPFDADLVEAAAGDDEPAVDPVVAGAMAG